MKPFLLLLMLAVTGAAHAQLTITTNFRQEAVWDEAGEKWDVYETNEDQTVFNFNREFTFFRHITPGITSKYTIVSYEYDEEKVQYTMDVESDAGYTYEVLIDGVNNCVAFFYYNEEDEYILVRHTIKDTHFDE